MRFAALFFCFSYIFVGRLFPADTCPPGYYKVREVNVSSCPNGFYKVLDVGAQSCPPGFYKVREVNVSSCPVGFYKVRDVGVSACPPGSYEPFSSIFADNDVCPAGYYAASGEVGTTTGQDERGTYNKTCSWQ
jgi:hypothetical protein